MNQRLPPLNPLRAFEATARNRSLTKAAKELCVTHGAISHQIKALETSLKVKLFNRTGQRLTLTEHGADLLPSVTSAFAEIAAATARIGIAEAARYPRISFMGILGLGGSTPEDLFDLDKLSTIALPQIQWSFLDFGRTRARIEQSQAALDEAESQYRQTVLGALQNAEDSLARFGRQRQSVAALARIHASAQRSADLMRQRYEAGVAPLTQSLDADRQALVAEQNLRQASAALTGSYIAVQKSLGLGWSETAEEG